MRRFVWLSVLSLALLPASAKSQDGPLANQRAVTVPSCLVTVLDEVEVAAPEAGLLDKVLVREGALIKLGTPLAQIDARQAILEQRKAEFELEVARKEANNDVNVRYAKAAWGVAKAEYESALEANRKSPGSVSDLELRQKELAMQKAHLQIEQSERDLDVAVVTAKTREVLVELGKLNVERRSIKAPLAGVVVDISKRPGEWVTPGDPVLRLVRVDRFRVEGLIDARRYGRELEHLAVTVEADIAGGKHAKYTGEVVFVSPEIEPVTNKVRLWAEVDNTDLQLRAGTRATMTIHLDQPVKPSAAANAGGPAP